MPRHERTALLPALLCLLTAGCVIDTRERDTLIAPVRTVDVAVAADQAIELRIPTAELRLRNGSDDRLRGRMRILCPERRGRCSEAMGDVEFVLSREPEAVRVALSRDSSWRYRHGRVEIDLLVPPERPLRLDLTGGAVHAVLDNCVEADVEAGDVDFTLPLARVARVDLDTGVGDATLSIDGRRIGGERSLLVGAEAHWDRGDGGCAVVMDLQAGDLRLDLDRAGAPGADHGGLRRRQ